MERRRQDGKDAMASKNVIKFYLGKGTDHAGRSVDQILMMSAGELESTHDYIQWLFPLSSASSASVDAPILDASAIAEFRGSEKLRSNLIRSLRVMLAFYGLELDDADEEDVWITEAPTFNNRSRVWLSRGNHNYLRMTRIMKSLALLGCRAHALGLKRFLLGLYRKAGGKIGSDTLKFWSDAVT